LEANVYVRTARRIGCFVAVLALAGLGAAQAQALGEVRIAHQFRLPYLALHVALELKLVEKHAKVMGEGDATVEVVRLASGAAVNLSSPGASTSQWPGSRFC
jgi:hypothetical protein